LIFLLLDIYTLMASLRLAAGFTHLFISPHSKAVVMNCRGWLCNECSRPCRISKFVFCSVRPWTSWEQLGRCGVHDVTKNDPSAGISTHTDKPAAATAAADTTHGFSPKCHAWCEGSTKATATTTTTAATAANAAASQISRNL